MPTVAYCTESDDDTETYASLLFSELIHQQIVEDVGPEHEIEVEQNLDFLYHTESAPLMKRLGRDLRILSEDFARSTERMLVKEKASKFDFRQLDYEEFKNFFFELFDGGITREKIVVLLFFCSDIVVKAYKSDMMTNLRKLFTWFLDYIIKHVCDWVRCHGGWEVVITQYVPALTKLTFYCVGTVVLVAILGKKIF